MSLRDKIIETANTLGVSPVDLATVISYETAGTFDPKKRGPTTQWGEHRGLIQWGEPQARRYGVDWSDPINSQLGARGAVVGYMRDAGVRPGMGLLDLYSAVNAGRVGRYNASDANNGGAPGTVRDKVEKQMSGHKRKAMALIGGSYKPSAANLADMAGAQPPTTAPFDFSLDSLPGVTYSAGQNQGTKPTLGQLSQGSPEGGQRLNPMIGTRYRVVRGADGFDKFVLG